MDDTQPLRPVGTQVTNGKGAVFEITGRDEEADNASWGYTGYFAVVVDNGRGVATGKTVYLDDRDFAVGRLSALPA